MEVKLIKDRLFLRKVADSYVLHRIKDNILTIEGDSQYTIGGIKPFYNLSKQNCDEIFGVVDVEKLADECSIDWNGEVMEGSCGIYKEGFNKAMALNKDKLFTLEDIKMAYHKGFYSIKVTTNGKEIELNSYIQSLQQPTEIEVEIEMSNIYAVPEPKLDSSGNLILKKI